MPNFILRKAQAKDVNSIHLFIKSAVAEHELLPRTKQDIKDNIGTFFVAENFEKEVIACCGLTVYGKKLAEIRSLVVKKDWQRQGVGHALAQECLRLAKQHKVYEVLAVTDRVDFFGNLGFRKWLGNQYPMIIRP